jgi:hypothetical protein
MLPIIVLVLSLFVAVYAQIHDQKLPSPPATRSKGGGAGSGPAPM